MTRLRGVIAGLLVVGLSGPAFAACPKDQVYKKIGTIADTTGGAMEQIVDGPIAIDAISWGCTGSACTTGWYDGDPGESGEGAEDDVVMERGAPASGGGFQAFDSPLYFADGVSVTGANLAGAMAYTCQPR